MMRCIVCSKKVILIKTKLPGFNHLDFSTITKNFNIHKCNNCQLAYNKNVINNFFYSTKYIKKNSDNKVLLNKKKLTRSDFISNIIFDHIKSKKNLKILEIGCGKGYLLNKLSKKIKKSLFLGNDIGNYKKYFTKMNIRFLKNYKNIIENGTVDLIIISHTFNYFKNPNKKLRELKDLLKKNGQIMIVVPNIKKNPYYTLMADQNLILTINSLKNILSFNHLDSKFINHKFLKNEIILFAKKNSSRNRNFIKDEIIEKNLKKLKKIKNKLTKIIYKNIVIFGTNVNSSFSDEILKKKNKFFVSDFAIKNNRFRNKKIISPNFVKDNFLLINNILSKNIINKKNISSKILNLL